MKINLSNNKHSKYISQLCYKVDDIEYIRVCEECIDCPNTDNSWTECKCYNKLTGASVECPVFCDLTNLLSNVVFFDKATWLSGTGDPTGSASLANDLSYYPFDVYGYEMQSQPQVTIPSPVIISSPAELAQFMIDIGFIDGNGDLLTASNWCMPLGSSMLFNSVFPDSNSGYPPSFSRDGECPEGTLEYKRCSEEALQTETCVEYSVLATTYLQYIYDPLLEYEEALTTLSNVSMTVTLLDGNTYTHSLITGGVSISEFMTGNGFTDFLTAGFAASPSYTPSFDFNEGGGVGENIAVSNGTPEISYTLYINLADVDAITFDFDGQVPNLNNTLPLFNTPNPEVWGNYGTRYQLCIGEDVVKDIVLDSVGNIIEPINIRPCIEEEVYEVQLDDCIEFENVLQTVLVDFDSLSFVDGAFGLIPSFTATINEDIPVGSYGQELSWDLPTGTTVTQFMEEGVFAEQLKLALESLGYTNVETEVEILSQVETDYSVHVYVYADGIESLQFNIDGADWSQNGAVLVDRKFGNKRGTRTQLCVDGVVVKEVFTDSVGNHIERPENFVECCDTETLVVEKKYDYITGTTDLCQSNPDNITVLHSDWASRPGFGGTAGYVGIRGYTGTGTSVTFDSVTLNGSAVVPLMVGTLLEIPDTDLIVGMNTVEVSGVDDQGLTFSFLELVEWNGTTLVLGNRGNTGFNIGKGGVVLDSCPTVLYSMGAGCPIGIVIHSFTIGQSTFQDATPCTNYLGEIVYGINDVQISSTAINGEVYMNAQMVIYDSEVGYSTTSEPQCVPIQEIKERDCDGKETYRFVVEDGKGNLVPYILEGTLLNECPNQASEVDPCTGYPEVITVLPKFDSHTLPSLELIEAGQVGSSSNQADGDYLAATATGWTLRRSGANNGAYWMLVQMYGNYNQLNTQPTDMFAVPIRKGNPDGTASNFWLVGYLSQLDINSPNITYTHPTPQDYIVSQAIDQAFFGGYDFLSAGDYSSVLGEMIPSGLVFDDGGEHLISLQGTTTISGNQGFFDPDNSYYFRAETTGAPIGECTPILQVVEEQCDGVETYRYVLEGADGVLTPYEPLGEVVGECSMGVPCEGYPKLLAVEQRYDRLPLVSGEPVECVEIQEIKEVNCEGVETYRFVKEDGNGVLEEYILQGELVNECNPLPIVTCGEDITTCDHSIGIYFTNTSMSPISGVSYGGVDVTSEVAAFGANFPVNIGTGNVVAFTNPLVSYLQSVGATNIVQGQNRVGIDLRYRGLDLVIISESNSASFPTNKSNCVTESTGEDALNVRVCNSTPPVSIESREVCLETSEGVLNAYAVLQLDESGTTLLRYENAIGEVVTGTWVNCNCDAVDIIIPDYIPLTSVVCASNRVNSTLIIDPITLSAANLANGITLVFDTGGTAFIPSGSLSSYVGTRLQIFAAGGTNCTMNNPAFTVVGDVSGEVIGWRE